MQPVRKASVRRWLDWELPGRTRQKTLVAMASIMGRCGCTLSSFSSNSRSVHATCMRTCTRRLSLWHLAAAGAHLLMQNAPAGRLLATSRKHGAAHALLLADSDWRRNKPARGGGGGLEECGDYNNGEFGRAWGLVLRPWQQTLRSSATPSS